MIPKVKPRVADELFDVVDEQDRVIRQAPRGEVHAHGWLHRAVHVLIRNQKGEVFLQKRSMLKDKSPGLWDSSCSGHVDAGEDYDQAVVRELGEELGLHVAAAPSRWFRIEACEETGQEFVWVYQLNGDGPFVLQPEEIDRGEWLAPAEIDRLVAERPEEYCPAFKLIWRLVQQRRVAGESL
ncbi:MAG: NUDIX domain-containing protein [Opitutus sp.]|nr:NUDIX domain-containing protein [Opitutus sp.]